MIRPDSQLPGTPADVLSGTAVMVSAPSLTLKGSYPEDGSTNEELPKPTSPLPSAMRHSSRASCHLVWSPDQEMLRVLNSSSKVSL